MVVAVRALVLVLLAGACLTATAARPVAAADVTAYRAAVRQAAEILRAGPADTATARRAAQALRAGTGDSQQQVLADLDSTPPDIADARQRLDALDASLQQPADAPGRDDADRNLKEILAQPRYAEAGPNLVEQLIDWFLRLLARLFSAASGGSPLFALIEIGIVVGVLLLVGTLVLLRFMRATRGTGDARAERRRAPERADHAFAEADRLAAAGDFAGAIRALTSAVATALGGVGTWETSPETVRELFRREGRLEQLRALLVPFEEAVYGRGEPDASTYQRAAEVAVPFRAPATAREKAA